MGKIVTIYLSDAEARDLENFCDENRCSQYSALKIAVKELLSKPIVKMEEETLITNEEEASKIIEEEFIEENEEPEAIEQTIETDIKTTRELLRRFLKKSQ